MKSYIFSLIERMSCKESVSSSDKSVSWNAHREAEQNVDIKWFPYLKELLDENRTSKNKRFRSAIYFIANAILKKNYNRDVCEFLIYNLSVEQDKYILSSILDGLAQLEPIVDIDSDIIITLCKSENWLIRHSAINALGTFKNRDSKEILYYYLLQNDEKKYKYEIIYANASLGKIGEIEDIPLLETKVNSRIRDVKLSTKLAIEQIKRNKHMF